MSNDEQYLPPTIQPAQTGAPETSAEPELPTPPVVAESPPSDQVPAESAPSYQMPSRRQVHQIRTPTSEYAAPVYQPSPPSYQTAANQPSPPSYQAAAYPPATVAAQPQYRATQNPYAYQPASTTGYQTVVTQPHQQPVHYVAPAPRRNTHFPTAIAAAIIGSLLASGLTAAIMHAQNASLSPIPVPITTVTDPGRVDQPVVTNSSVDNPVWQEVIVSVADSVVAIQANTPAGGSVGSGFIIDSTGHVLSNNHVVTGAENNQVEVTLADGRLYLAEILGTDAVTDLALLQLLDIPADLHPVALGDSDHVRVGDAVLAIGNPLGLTNTATTGIVSALDRPVTAGGSVELGTTTTNAIQIDAAVNPGNSGGPIFDATGRVIGVTSSIASLSGGFSGQAGSIGLGFAIPINLVKNITEQLINDGSAEHAFMGVSIEPGTATSGGVTRRGALIRLVNPGTPAARAGLESGDVIIAINERPVNSHESVTALVREHRAGDVIRVTFVRGNDLREVAVTLDALDTPAQDPAPAPQSPEDSPAETEELP